MRAEEKEARTGDGVNIGQQILDGIREIKARDKSVLDLGKEFWADVYAVQAGAEKPVFGTGNFKKKVVSESMGVHPEQIEELRAINKQLGTEVEIDERGRPVFDNSQQMRQYAKARGWRHYGY